MQRGEIWFTQCRTCYDQKHRWICSFVDTFPMKMNSYFRTISPSVCSHGGSLNFTIYTKQIDQSLTLLTCSSRYLYLCYIIVAICWYSRMFIISLWKRITCGNTNINSNWFSNENSLRSMWSKTNIITSSSTNCW